MPASEPWYASYFAPQWWEVAAHEYTASRTATEVAYLAEALRGAPGRRVLDLGCGTGRHAIGLAALGFDVVGLDSSDWAVQTAQRNARAAGVAARFVQADLLRSLSLPPADAAICVQSFGWGTDADQERLLRTVRRYLAPGGLLVLDHSSATAILRHHVPYAEFRVDGLEADFHRAYQALSGRSAGRIDVRSSSSGEVSLYDDIRLYQPPEVRALLERAGFTVERADADFAAGACVTPETRYVQFIARAADPRTAIATWSGSSPGDGPVIDGLDLRWTPDEYDFVRSAAAAALSDVDSAAAERAYSLADPFGGERACGAIARHFGIEAGPDMVTFGAGATGLLHSLAMLSLPGPLLCADGGHPDAPAWARRFGGAVVSVPSADLSARIDAVRPSMVMVDRPTILADLCDLASVAGLASAAERVGALLVVDEAYANYAGPVASAVRLVPGHPNLVVVRSMSKAYCCGGLRAGFAVAGAAATAMVREVAPPLAVSEASVAACVALLGAGDVFGPLRDRIAAVKPLAVRRLSAAGYAVREGSPHLPWVTVRADTESHAEDGVRRRLAASGLLLKAPFAVAGQMWLKVALPLSDERLAAFDAALTAGAMAGR